jgi:hypothetical protein
MKFKVGDEVRVIKGDFKCGGYGGEGNPSCCKHCEIGMRRKFIIRDVILGDIFPDPKTPPCCPLEEVFMPEELEKIERQWVEI